MDFVAREAGEGTKQHEPDESKTNRFRPTEQKEPTSKCGLFDRLLLSS